MLAIRKRNFLSPKKFSLISSSVTFALDFLIHGLKELGRISYSDNKFTPLHAHQFITSNIGLKIYHLIAKVSLLMVKSFIQEWFTINVYCNSHFNLRKFKVKKETDEYEDDRFYLDRIIETVVLPSFTFLCPFPPLAPLSSLIPFPREYIILKVYNLIYKMRNVNILNIHEDEIKELLENYELCKFRYLNAKPNMENIYEMKYEQDKNINYLEKKLTEDEFNLFEDLETNLQLNLKSLMKMFEAFLYLKSDYNKFNELFNECLKIDENNFYALQLKVNYLMLKYSENSELISDRLMEGYELCNRVLTILQNVQHSLPIREDLDQKINEIPKDEREYLPTDNRIIDLILNPFCYPLALFSLYLIKFNLLPRNEVDSYFITAMISFTMCELYTRLPLRGAYYLEKADLYFIGNSLEKAVSSFEKFEKYFDRFNKENIIFQFEKYATCLLRLGKPVECREMLDKYVKLYNGHFRMKWLQFRVEYITSETNEQLEKIKEKLEQFINELSEFTNASVVEVLNNAQTTLLEIKGKIKKKSKVSQFYSSN
ncbi:hypothetical protein ABK040_005248 [Willaertia magna]